MKKFLLGVVVIIVVIVSICLISITNKVLILKKISTMADDLKNTNNYTAKIEEWTASSEESTEKNILSVTEIYYKDGKVKEKINDSIVWIDYNANEGYAFDVNKKETNKLDLSDGYKVADKDTLATFRPIILTNNFGGYLKTAMTTKIKSENEKYILTIDSSKYIINKENGLLELEAIELSDGSTMYKSYEMHLDKVTDSDVECPSLN